MNFKESIIYLLKFKKINELIVFMQMGLIMQKNIDKLF